MPEQDKHLPEEVLGLIVTYLNPRSSQDLQKLGRLSQSSKQLHRLAEPVLYQSFPGQKCKDARLFLQAILARPGRAQQVQHITVHEFIRWRSASVDDSHEEVPQSEETSEHSDTSEGEHSPQDGESSDEDLDRLTSREILLSEEGNEQGKLDDDSIPMLHQLVENAKVKPRIRGQLQDALDECVQQDGSANMDLIMSLIVLACPELDTIDIWVCDGFEQALLPLALTSRTGSIGQINLHREGPRDNRDVQGALETLARLNVFERRSVQCLEVTNDSLNYIMDPGEEDIFEPWPSIESIRLKECAVPTPALEILLKGCPALKTLELRLEQPLVNCGDLLREHGRGLQDLVLETDDRCIEDDPGIAYGIQHGLYGIGSLKDFTNLEKLEVAPWALLRLGKTARLIPNTRFHEIFPPNLQSLTILPFEYEIELDLDENLRLLRQASAFANLEVRVL